MGPGLRRGGLNGGDLRESCVTVSSLDSYLTLATELADAAGATIRPYFRTALAVDDKADLSPVTAADRAAERVMRQMIAARFPEHGIIGEEYGREREDAEFVWVLDPIDGTKSFISGVPLFGTLIALAQHGRSILGVIDQPISRERWVGAAGRATTHNGRPIRCRACPGIAAATVFATTPAMFEGADAEAFGRVAGAAKLVRYGADCYAYGLVALGFADIVIEASLKTYDFGAMLPIIEGAGGIATDWQGAPLGLSSDGRVLIAGDKRTHSDALHLLRG
jgi:inositol-phosphate phosphatase/L-galactose 1-phosphate phosphatase/histidinol-phosphatase